ncbi:protein of unknown function [Agrobacterium pusense]|uniref:Uncharacterized protein n=1 Tax=Agrobacterium pusense TaxID=648995 RepID=U4Q264_9HYPH|nr:protein of unknown function [Agrobacterium pusense]
MSEELRAERATRVIFDFSIVWQRGVPVRSRPVKAGAGCATAESGAALRGRFLSGKKVFQELVLPQFFCASA